MYKYFTVVIIKKTDIFNKWLLKLKDRQAQFIISTRIRKIEIENHFGDYKNVGNNIFELRIFFGSGYRIYFTFENDTIIILLCGGDKSTQQEDIKKAKDMI